MLSVYELNPRLFWPVTKGRLGDFMSWRQRQTMQDKNISTFLGNGKWMLRTSKKGKCQNLEYSLQHDNFRILHLHMSRQMKAGTVKRPKATSALHDAACDQLVNAPLVKVCGVTNVRDAIMAAEAGAKYVGMILWPKSRRSISLDVAKEIAYAVREHQAEPVGVFVDENADTIVKCCKEADILIAQLHGEGARSSLLDLPSYLQTIYVLHVDKDGVVQTTLPITNQVDWILLDSLQGGSGDTFDWKNFKAPSLNSKQGWLLAGGLNPGNVAAAISILQPNAVDVSSGVTGLNGILKDNARVSAFIDAVNSCGEYALKEHAR